LNSSRSGIADPRTVIVHTFSPSDRRICSMVGRDAEYWTEPDLGFCSCKSYYYRSLSSGKPGYHLTKAVQSIKEKTFTAFEFEDDEYDQFIRAIIHDSSNNVLRL
jgi:predicted nucleic acid-binding Zn finger protein